MKGIRPLGLLLCDTLTASLAKLTGDEQKAVKTTAFDLRLSPASPGLQFHRLERAKDPNFWSVRVNLDLRLIVHKTPTSRGVNLWRIFSPSRLCRD